jgi:tellurite resistance protein
MVAERTASAKARMPVAIPANLFAIGFGLAGLAGCWRVASATIGAPIWVANLIAVLAAVAWLLVGAAWTAQLLRRTTTIDGELHDPRLGPFVSLLPIVGMLLSVQLYPYAHGAGRVAFGLFAAAALLLGGWLTGQWISDRLDIDALHPGYFLPTVASGLLGAGGAAAVGWHGLADGLFGIGVICWMLLGSVMIVRLFSRPPVPAPLSPTLAIELAPPAVAGSTYLALTGGRYGTVAWALAGYAVLMVLVQLRLIPLYRRTPFGPGYWSFTFSYAAAATLAVHWISHEHPAGTTAWTWAVLALITCFIGAIAARTLLALARRQFLPTSGPAPAGPAATAGGGAGLSQDPLQAPAPEAAS